MADSLAGLEVPDLRTAETVGDVGSGAGFPGLPLAVALPEARVDLIESSRRKGEVSERLATAAGIVNARCVWARVEAWARGEGREAYEAVTARAVASLPVLVEYAAPLLRVGGVFVAWRGRRDAADEKAGDAAGAVLGLGSSRVLQVSPFPDARDRHLHVYVKRSTTPERFPRRPGIASKRPLA